MKNKVFTVILILTFSITSNAYAGYAGAARWFVVKVFEVVAVDTIIGLAKQELAQADEIDPNENIRNIAKQHFKAEGRCDVDESISFYDDIVYYEGNDISKNKLKILKNHVCSRSSDKHVSIRNNNFVVSSTQKENIKIIDYETDYDVFDNQKQIRRTGTTRVRLLIRIDTSSPKIMGESYTKLS
jgi:hypothetical protein